jgi:hypothetical protein
MQETPAVDVALVLLAADRLQPALDFWEGMVVEGGLGVGKSNHERIRF